MISVQALEACKHWGGLHRDFGHCSVGLGTVTATPCSTIVFSDVFRNQGDYAAEEGMSHPYPDRCGIDAARAKSARTVTPGPHEAIASNSASTPDGPPHQSPWLSHFLLSSIISSFNHPSDERRGHDRGEDEDTWQTTHHDTPRHNETPTCPLQGPAIDSRFHLFPAGLDAQRWQPECELADDSRTHSDSDVSEPSHTSFRARRLFNAARRGLIHSRRGPKRLLEHTGRSSRAVDLETCIKHDTEVVACQEEAAPEAADVPELSSDSENTCSQSEISSIVSEATSPDYCISYRPPVAWYRAWPAIVEYYRYHRPDYTGSKLYQATFTPATEYLSEIMPDTMDAQIYFAESVKIIDRLDDYKITWLKRQAIRRFNKRLTKRGDSLNPESIAIVAHFVADAYIAGDDAALRTHLKGLLQLIKLMGGIVQLQGSFAAHVVVRWIVALCKSYCPADIDSYFHPNSIEDSISVERVDHDGALTIDQNLTSNCGKNGERRYGLHPLRMAIHPLRSGLSQGQLRHHLVISIGSPMQDILYVQTAMEDTLATLSMLEITPAKAVAALRNLRDLLEAQEANRVSYQLPTPPFSEEDALNHDVVIECARLCTQLLIAQALHRLDPTPATVEFKKKLEISIWGLQITPSVVQRQWKVILWLLYTTISFCDTDDSQLNMIVPLSKLCDDLRVSYWHDMRAFLREYFFCGWLQEECGLRLWLKIQDQISM